MHNLVTVQYSASDIFFTATKTLKIIEASKKKKSQCRLEVNLNLIKKKKTVLVIMNVPF